MISRLHTMNEVAATMRVSRRWLQDFLHANPFYQLAGRKKVFTDENVARLIAALPSPENTQRRTRAKPQARASDALLREALALCGERRQRKRP